MADNKELKELAGLFLRPGLTAFGGPAAHIAMMQKEVVEKRRWLTHQHFLDLLGATQLIPGQTGDQQRLYYPGGNDNGVYFAVAVK